MVTNDGTESTGLGLDEEITEKGPAQATSPVLMVDVQRVLGRANGNGNNRV